MSLAANPLRNPRETKAAIGAVDLGLGRAYELRVSRAQSLGFRLGFKVRSDRFRVRAGL